MLQRRSVREKEKERHRLKGKFLGQMAPVSEESQEFSVKSLGLSQASLVTSFSEISSAQVNAPLFLPAPKFSYLNFLGSGNCFEVTLRKEERPLSVASGTFLISVTSSLN